LRGLIRYVPKSGQLNVLWVISHPDLLATQECDDYDLVLVASARMRERLTDVTRTPIHVLEQATDPAIFFPDPDPRHHRDLVFVGNSRRVRRPILNDLLPTSHDLAVWGKGWDGLIEPRYVVGSYLPNEEVRRAYSSAAIVLNDHWPDMQREGLISNRIYDALACGALVLSDYLPELHDRFPGAIATYTTSEELRELVDRFLAHPEERAAINRSGRQLVLGGHTFAHRVDELLRLVLPALRGACYGANRSTMGRTDS
jgi:spore maturation protein CgeB